MKKTTILSLFILMTIISLSACKKNEELNDLNNNDSNLVDQEDSNDINNDNQDEPNDEEVENPNLRKLKSPFVLVNSDGVAGWNDNDYASGYKYKINGGEEIQTTKTSIKINDGDTIEVKAIGNGTLYSNSDFSVQKKYEKDKSIKNISYSIEEALTHQAGELIYVKGKLKKAPNSFTGSVFIEDYEGNYIYINDLYTGTIENNYKDGIWSEIGAKTYSESNLNLEADDYVYLFGKLDMSARLVLDNALILDYIDVVEPTGVDKIMMDYVDSLIETTDGYIPSWNKESFKGKWNYIDGVFLNSIVNLCNQLDDKNPILADKYRNFFLNYINYYIDENGEFINLKASDSAGFTTGELDTICESKILFDAFEYTGDSRYLKGIETSYEALGGLRIVDGTNNYSHKTSYDNQIWLDGLYMYAPFYVRYAIARGEDSYFDNLVQQYKNVRDLMFDDEKKLYHHGYDGGKSIFWANPETGCSESFWLRSMGWYIVSIADVLDYFPEGENKEYLKGLLKEALDGVLQYQDAETKMFYQVVDMGKAGLTVPSKYLSKLGNKQYQNSNGTYSDTYIENYVETSGSSMIAYSLIKGANRGYIDEEYYQKGLDVFNGIYNHSFNPETNELKYICITAGLGPSNRTYRDGTAEYYLAEIVGSNDAKGVGPFIMSYLEYANRD